MLHLLLTGFDQCLGDIDLYFITDPMIPLQLRWLSPLSLSTMLPLDIASLCFTIFSSPFDHFILKLKEVNTILKRKLLYSLIISSLFPFPFVFNRLLAQLNLSQDVFPFIERKRIWGHCDANTQTRWLPPSGPAQKDCQSPPFPILCHLGDFLSEEKWKFFLPLKKLNINHRLDYSALIWAFDRPQRIRPKPERRLGMVSAIPCLVMKNWKTWWKSIIEIVFFAQKNIW